MSTQTDERALEGDPFGDLLRRCEREGYDCRIATMRDGTRVMLIADGRRVEILSKLTDIVWTQ